MTLLQCTYSYKIQFLCEITVFSCKFTGIYWLLSYSNYTVKLVNYK